MSDDWFELFVITHWLSVSDVVSVLVGDDCVLIWDDLMCFSKFVNRRRATCVKGIVNKSLFTVNKIRGSRQCENAQMARKDNYWELAA